MPRKAPAKKGGKGASKKEAKEEVVADAPDNKVIPKSSAKSSKAAISKKPAGTKATKDTEGIVLCTCVFILMHSYDELVAIHICINIFI